MPPPPRPRTSEQYFFFTFSSTSPMANNTWDLYSLSNHHRPQSQTRPIIIPAQVSNQIQYCRIFAGDHRPAGVFPVIRSGTGSSLHLNRSFTTTVVSQGTVASTQGGFLSGSQEATASAIRRFLRMSSQRPAAVSARSRRSQPAAPPPPVAVLRMMSQRPAAMSARPRGSQPAAPPPPAAVLRMISQRPAAMSAWPRRSRPAAPPPPPPAARNRRAISRGLNNNRVAVRGRMRKEPVPDQESETDESAGTQPHINLLDNPIGNDERAAEEPASEEDDNLTLKL